jgi:hypothetical protein
VILLALFLGALAAPDVLTSGTYHYTFDGTFWNAAKRSAASDQTIVRSGAQITLRVKPAGEAERDARPTEMSALGDVALIVTKAGTSPIAGAAWKTALPVQTGQSTDENTSVPMDVRVVRVDANGALVQGTGTAHAIEKSGQFTNPTDLSIRVAALIRDGVLLRYDEDVTDYIHAGSLSQELHWRWSLARTGG